MELLVLNDLHFGFKRQAGVTPASLLALQYYLLTSTRKALEKWHDTLLLNGDTFDGFDVGTLPGLQVYTMLRECLVESRSRKLILAMGNHDVSKNTTTLPTFFWVAHTLQNEFGDRVEVVTAIGGAVEIRPRWWVVPHMVNQAAFDAELEKVYEQKPRLVFVHANYNNHFALEADHSLNVTEEVAEKFASVPSVLVFGHEHQARDMLGGRVLITGNQFPTSISDCLHNQEKFAHVFHDDGTYTRIVTWQAKYSYFEIDWACIDQLPATAQFVRVTGQAEADMMPKVLDQINRLRQSHGAFVVTNAVKVTNANEPDIAGLEDAASFDALEFLYGLLDEKQVSVIKGVLEND